MNPAIQAGAQRKSLNLARVISFMLLAATQSQAADLWSNGSVNGTFTSDNRCDSGPNLCGNSGSTFWTIFDNFNIPASSKDWLVSGFDFTDVLLNGTIADYKDTQWSIWNGDPLAGGRLVASGTATAVPSLVSGTCGSTSTCLVTFTATLASNVLLASGNTYYLGTTNNLSVTNSGETTYRAFAAGGNTAPGGAPNPIQRWEQSNGTTTGVAGSTWMAGSNNFIFPGFGVTETATAFDIQGVLAPAAPPTFTKTIATPFGGGSINQGDTTPVTFTLSNPNSFALTGLAFTDTLPSGLSIQNPNGLTNSCGGTVTAVPGTATISLMGGTVGAMTSCAISVNVTGIAPGQQANPSVTLTTNEAGAAMSAPVSVFVNAWWLWFFY